MRNIKKNFHNLEMKPWDDSPQGRDEFIRLKQFLSLAPENRIGIVTLEMMSKFQKDMYPLLLTLLLLGAIRRKKIRCHKEEELFLFSLLVIFFLIFVRYGTITFYIGTRHMIAPVILCLAWVGVGVFEVEYRMRHTTWLIKSRDKRGVVLRNMQ